jgi:hypothetical protein
VIACAGSGVACAIIGFEIAAVNLGIAVGNGASFDQTILNAGVGLGIGIASGGLSIEYGLSDWQGLVLGVASAAVTTGIANVLSHRDFFQYNLLEAALLSAAQGAATLGLRKAIAVSQASSAPAVRSKGGIRHIDIQETSSYGFPDAETAADIKGNKFNTNWWANKSEILYGLTHADSGDIFTFFGHAVTSSSTGQVIGILGDSWFRDVDLISPSEISQALTADDSPPSVVVLAGCSSEKLLGSVIDSGVPVAIGFSDNVPFVLGAKATDVVLWNLQSGASIVSAVDAANTFISQAQISTPAEVVVQVGSNIDVNKSLRGNGL